MPCPYKYFQSLMGVFSYKYKNIIFLTFGIDSIDYSLVYNLEGVYLWFN